MKNSVNKNFIYTWKEESIPKKYVKNIESWMKYHNDWTFLFFSDKDIERFINEKFPQYKKIFNGFQRPIERVDFFKYLALYEIGGIYIDCDVLLYKNLEEIIIDHNIFFKEKDVAGKDRYGPFLFYSKGKTLLLKKIIDNVVFLQRIKEVTKIKDKNEMVLYSTGPIMLDNFLRHKKFTGYNVDYFEYENSKYGFHSHDGNWVIKK